MRDAAVVGGVLGLGCAVVFVVAAAVSFLFPNGTLVTPNYFGGGGVWVEKGIPMPAPVDPVMIDIPVEDAEK